MKEEMDMQLHGYWQDGAVIQQGAPFTVTGRVQTARTITVRLMREEDGEELERVVCTAADGRFSATLQGRPGSYASYALLCEGEGETGFLSRPAVWRGVAGLRPVQYGVCAAQLRG